jgi:hypothetical protein
MSYNLLLLLLLLLAQIVPHLALGSPFKEITISFDLTLSFLEHFLFFIIYQDIFQL